MFEVDERRDAALRVFVDPTVMQLTNGDRVEVVELLPADLVSDDQVGFLEHFGLGSIEELYTARQTNGHSDGEPNVELSLAATDAVAAPALA